VQKFDKYSMKDVYSPDDKEFQEQVLAKKDKS